MRSLHPGALQREEQLDIKNLCRTKNIGYNILMYLLGSRETGKDADGLPVIKPVLNMQEPLKEQVMAAIDEYNLMKYNTERNMKKSEAYTLQQQKNDIQIKGQIFGEKADPGTVAKYKRICLRITELEKELKTQKQRKTTLCCGKQARRYVDVIQQMKAGGIKQANIGECLKEYMLYRPAYHKKAINPDRLIQIEKNFTDFMKSNPDLVIIEETTPQHIENYINYLHNLERATDTITKNTSDVRSVYNFLVKRRGYKMNPTLLFSGLVGGMEGTNKEKYISPTQFINLLDAVDNPDWNFMLRLMFDTWLRTIELRRMKVNDLYIDRPVLTVPRGKGFKQKNKREIELSMNIWRELLERTRNRKPDDPLIELPCDNGKRCPDYNDIQQKLVMYAKRADITIKSGENITPHTIRHIGATYARMRGISLADISDKLGHAELSTTRKYYQHIQVISDKEMQRRIFEDLDKKLNLEVQNGV